MFFCLAVAGERYSILFSPTIVPPIPSQAAVRPVECRNRSYSKSTERANHRGRDLKTCHSFARTFALKPATNAHARQRLLLLLSYACNCSSSSSSVSAHYPMASPDVLNKARIVDGKTGRNISGIVWRVANNPAQLDIVTNRLRGVDDQTTEKEAEDIANDIDLKVTCDVDASIDRSKLIYLVCADNGTETNTTSIVQWVRECACDER